MAWWLVDSVLNGTLDEDYPIMSKDKVTVLGGGGNDTISLESSENATADYITFTGLSSAVAAADTISLDYSWWGDDGFSITGNPSSEGKDSISFRTDGYPGTIQDSSTYGAAFDPITFGGTDTLNLGASHLPGGMGNDHISLDVGAGNTAWDWDPGLAHTHYDEPKYYADVHGLVAGSVDDVYSFHYPGLDTKPQPNLKYQQQKYGEDKGIKDLKDYVSSTYQGHYTNDNSDVQTLDLIHSVGDAESFCRSNALKYLSRYDKKGSAKKDILKAMHYCLLLYYFSGNTQEPDYTNTRYETF